MQSQLWESFFSGLTLDVMSHSRGNDEIVAEAAFIERVLQMPPHGRVLDVPCGSGRHAAEMAKRGYKVTGLDLSASLLAQAELAGAGDKLSLSWVQGDMREMAWEDEFDGAYCFWGSLGYFDQEGDTRFLSGVAHALKSGARFIIDTPILETVLPSLRERTWTSVGDILLAEQRHYDHLHSRIDREWTLVRDGNLEQHALSIRIYTYRELSELLGSVGLGDFKGYGSLNQEPFRVGLQRFFMVATKC